MLLSKFTISNYKSFDKPYTLEIDGAHNAWNTIIEGGTGSGKTNLLKAIYLLKDIVNGNIIGKIYDSYNDNANACHLEIEFFIKEKKYFYQIEFDTINVYKEILIEKMVSDSPNKIYSSNFDTLLFYRDFYNSNEHKTLIKNNCDIPEKIFNDSQYPILSLKNLIDSSYPEILKNIWNHIDCNLIFLNYNTKFDEYDYYMDEAYLIIKENKLEDKVVNFIENSMTENRKIHGIYKNARDNFVISYIEEENIYKRNFLLSEPSNIINAYILFAYTYECCQSQKLLLIDDIFKFNVDFELLFKIIGKEFASQLITTKTYENKTINVLFNM